MDEVEVMNLENWVLELRLLFWRMDRRILSEHENLSRVKPTRLIGHVSHRRALQGGL